MLGLAVADVASPSPSLAPPPPAIVQGLGYSAGFTSGIGFHYRQFHDGGLGLGWGATGAAGWSPADGNGAFSIGVEGFKTIFLLDWGRFYGVLAAARFGQIAFKTPTAPVGSFSNAGLGLGIDFGPIKGVNLSVEVPYTFFFDRNLAFQNAFPVPNVVMTFQY